MTISGLSLTEAGLLNASRGKESQAADAIHRAGNLNDPKRLRELAQDFESLIVHMMIKTMRETIQKDDLFGGGLSEETYQGMLDEQYASEMAAAKGFGFADLVYRQLVERLSERPSDSTDARSDTGEAK